jgi:Flp pilus assembly protein TadG
MTCLRPPTTRRQRGIAAVELALVLPVFLILLTFPLYLGRVYWHYTIIQRAAQDAGRYLSSIPLSEMRNPARAPALVAVAYNIIDAELAEVAPGAYHYLPLVACDINTACGGFVTPTTVSVSIGMQIDDIFFSDVTSLTLPLTVMVTYPYLGN